MSDPLDPSWYLERRRRWPLDAGVTLAAVLLVWAVAAGRGSHLARADAPLRGSVLRAMQPPVVPDSSNAAILWQKAAQAVVPWGELERAGRRDPPNEDFLVAETYAPGSQLRKWLAANQSALALAAQASQIEACVWDIDWSKGVLALPKSGTLGISDNHPIAQVMLRDGMLAAFQGQWQIVERDLRQLLVLSGHQAHGPGTASFMLASSTARAATALLKDGLSFPGCCPDSAFLNHLAAIARIQSQQTIDVLPYLPFDHHAGIQLMDRMGNGDLSELRELVEARSITLPSTQIPLALNLYAPFYPLDRLMIDQRYAARAIDPFRDGPEELKSILYGHTGARFLMSMTSVLGLIHGLAQENSSRWRIAQVAIAMEMWSAAHGGEWPSQLEDLGLDPDILNDPFLPGKSLHFQKRDDGGLDLWRFRVIKAGEVSAEDLKPTDADFRFRGHIIFHLGNRRVGP